MCGSDVRAAEKAPIRLRDPLSESAEPDISPVLTAPASERPKAEPLINSLKAKRAYRTTKANTGVLLAFSQGI